MLSNLFFIKDSMSKITINPGLEQTTVLKAY